MGPGHGATAFSSSRCAVPRSRVAIERDDVRCGDKVNAGAQTSSDGEGFKSCHDRAARPATLFSLVYDNIDCEAVHRAVADSRPIPTTTPPSTAQTAATLPASALSHSSADGEGQPTERSSSAYSCTVGRRSTSSTLKMIAPEWTRRYRLTASFADPLVAPITVGAWSRGTVGSARRLRASEHPDTAVLSRLGRSTNPREEGGQWAEIPLVMRDPACLLTEGEGFEPSKSLHP